MTSNVRIVALSFEAAKMYSPLGWKQRECNGSVSFRYLKERFVDLFCISKNLIAPSEEQDASTSEVGWKARSLTCYFTTGAFSAALTFTKEKKGSEVYHFVVV